MAVEKKTYLVNVKSNLDKYAKEAAIAKKNVDTLKTSNDNLKKGGKATAAEIEKSSSALRNAQTEYRKAKKLVDLQTQANNSNINSRKQLNAIVAIEQQRLGKLANVYTRNQNGVLELSMAYKQQVKALSQAKGAVIAYDQAQKDGRSNVGRYTSSILKSGQSMLQTMGIFASAAIVFRAFFNVIKKGFQTTFAFEKSMAEVRAILRGTREEMDLLTASAMKLGGSTKFTASEVAGLQKEYAKLGFTANEILKITKGTLAVAAAAGADLSQAASVAGASLRQFNLDATEMARIVDVMALSFSMTALDIQKYQDAMKSAGPVAAAVGDTVEDTTAKLGALANAGLDASTSGTSLRNIYLELEARGLTWNQAMTKIQGSQNKASTSLELFGKRGAVAGLVLAENTELLGELTEEFNNASGTAEEMAGVMLDNVAGSATILKSAWKGLILRTNQSSGAIKTFLDGLTTMVTYINTKGKPAIDRMFDVRTIETFGDKVKFYGDQGLGLLESLQLALFSSKERVQEYSDEMSDAYAKILEAEDAELAIKLAAEAEKKRLESENLKRIQAEVEAEEKASEERKKIAEQEAAEAKKRLDEELEAELDHRKKMRSLRQENNLLLAEDERAKAELKLVQSRDDAILESNHADEIALIWENYYLRLEELQETYRKKGETEEGFDEVAIAAINEQNKLEVKRLARDYEFEIERKALELKYNAEIENAKKTGADVSIIKEKYTLAQIRLDELEVKTKHDLYADFAGNLATIFGKNTAIGKAAAVAQTAIATYTSATEAFKALAGIPIVGPVLGAAAAAAAIASGLANVRKILSVKSGLPGDSGGGVSVPTSITSTPAAQQVFASQVPSSFMSQPQLSQEELNQSTADQKLLTANDIAEAVRELPSPIVTVEDINARADRKRKVEVRGNV